MSSTDIIVAPATPAGESALAMVRLSGPHCLRLLRECFPGLKKMPPPRRATLAKYVARDGQDLDEVILIPYAAGSSFTGEEMLELSCHGNPLIVRNLLVDLAARGCRLAEPGEFTRRAFLNGRLDLSQAEAVADLIQARTERALLAARRQLEGAVGREINRLVESLVSVTAQLEAYIDFPEEDLPPEDLADFARRLQALRAETSRLAATAPYSTLLKEGIRAVILGAPNAGKSSLLNALMGEDRALVSAEPGTTRDYLEERLRVGGHLLRVVDTAGLREAASELEARGMGKTVEQAQRADIILLLLDATAPSPPLPSEVQALLGQIPTLVVENKIDLPTARDLGKVHPEWPHCRVSALTGEGLEPLREQVARVVEQRLPPPPAEQVLVSARHAEALREAASWLEAAETKLHTGEPAELIASDLRAVRAAWEQIVGAIDNERVLDQVFASFCIGK